MIRAPTSGAEAPDGVLTYPPGLAQRVVDQWVRLRATGQVDLAPPTVTDLTAVLSTCYHATLLREEGWPVTFRLALSAPSAFDAAAGPPSGLHRLVFDRPLPLDQHELRRLTPSAAFSRSLIGANEQREIWGIIHSGPQWLQTVRGGRATEQFIPQVPIVAATGPGRLVVSVGSTVLAELRDGRLSGGDMDVFGSTWMLSLLAEARSDDWTEAAHATVDANFQSVLAGHVLRRVLATVRAAQHGGTLLIVPRNRLQRLVSTDRFIDVKYGFRDEEPRRRVLTLMGTIASALAAAETTSDGAVGWRAYEASRVRDLVDLDDALFEVAHLVADLAHVDGAVLMTDSLELIGFGVEIAGNLPEVTRVARATDPDANTRTWVRTDRVGTRHRSAYRLCQAVPEALALVVSQDGGLRFIRWHQDAVTYWEQAATGPWEG